MQLLNLKLMILLEYKNIKTFLPKVTFQIDLKRFLLLQKLKTLCCGHVICDKKRDLFLIKKYLQYGKAAIVLLTVGLIKKTQYK